MGRQAKPTQLHLLEGNKSHLTKAEIDKRQKAEESMTFKSDAIKAPSWLNDDAKKIFRKLVRDFESTELLVNVDVYALAFFCDSYSDYIRFTQIILKEGDQLEHTNKAGETNKVPHPLLTKKKQAFEQCMKVMGEFGLSPSSRTKIIQSLDKGEDESENPFGERL